MSRLMVLVVLAGCGRIDFSTSDGRGANADGNGSGTSDGGTDGMVSARCVGPYTWSAPQAIPELESTSDDWAPAISPDNQLMVFSSNRGATYDLYSATRQGASWTVPVPVAALDKVGCDTGDPIWNATGTRLYFAQTCGGLGLWVADYDAANGFHAPIQIPGLEAIDGDGPALSADELELFYTLESASPHTTGHATRTAIGAMWTDLGVDADFFLDNSESGFGSLSADGMTFYFESDFSLGATKIFTATRAGGTASPFGGFAQVNELADATADDDGDPDLSWDCETIYFSSNRTAAEGLSDIYVSTRTN